MPPLSTFENHVWVMQSISLPLWSAINQLRPSSRIAVSTKTFFSYFSFKILIMYTLVLSVHVFPCFQCWEIPMGYVWAQASIERVYGFDFPLMKWSKSEGFLSSVPLRCSVHWRISSKWHIHPHLSCLLLWVSQCSFVLTSWSWIFQKFNFLHSVVAGLSSYCQRW